MKIDTTRKDKVEKDCPDCGAKVKFRNTFRSWWCLCGTSGTVMPDMSLGVISRIHKDDE